MFNLWLTSFKFRTHDLLDEIKENGLKGKLVDFVWVEFAPSLGLANLVTDPLLKVTWMKCKTCSSLKYNVTFTIMLGDNISEKHNVVIVSLCRNPDGFLWAGDTTKSLSIGSSFTFKRLREFVHSYQVCDSDVPYMKLNVSSEINPSSAWYPKSP